MCVCELCLCLSILNAHAVSSWLSRWCRCSICYAWTSESMLMPPAALILVDTGLAASCDKQCANFQHSSTIVPNQCSHLRRGKRLAAQAPGLVSGTCCNLHTPTHRIYEWTLFPCRKIDFRKVFYLLFSTNIWNHIPEIFILQNLILRTRSCRTGFITQSSWFFHFQFTTGTVEMFGTTVWKGHLVGVRP